MKIEKVSENQIRCTLTREDLASREIKISELAYGTEKAKSLFRDMMQQANFEFGFEAEDIPLMIEAIPLNAECIVLIITKVEDPEELDTRFSRFAPSSMEEDEEYDEDFEDSDDHQEMLDLFHKLQETREDATQSKKNVAEVPTEEQLRTRIFSMASITQAMSVAGFLSDSYTGQSALYKDAKEGKYILVLIQGNSTRENFDRASNMLSEYGILQKSMSASRTFLEEHCEVLIPNNAIALLSGKA